MIHSVATVLCLALLSSGDVSAFAPQRASFRSTNPKIRSLHLSFKDDTANSNPFNLQLPFASHNDKSDGDKSTKQQVSSGYASNQNFFPWQKQSSESLRDSSKMGDLVKLMDDSDPKDPNKGMDDPTRLLIGAGALAVAGGAALAHHAGITVADATSAIQTFVQNPQDSLNQVIDSVQAMGPMGPVIFGLVYLVAEILAIPATPLTLSAGYLFGLPVGVSVVLIAATLAASFSFVIGKTFLRSWVEELLNDNPNFRKIDKAIAQEGFQLLLLVRLSPLFPFALSNYLYGASAIDFGSYFWGTLLGFAPGTIAYVYCGMVGQALTVGQGEPWYVYAGGFTLLLAFLKTVTDIATRIVDEIEDDDSMMNRG